MKVRVIIFSGMIAVLAFASGLIQAFVTSPEKTASGSKGTPINIPVTVSADRLVAGINGQLNYDPAYFSSPSVTIASGSMGFTALGNEIAPGQFRFVLYANPTSVMQLGTIPVLIFRLMITDQLSVNTSTDLTYTLMAAADPNGASLSEVNFQKITVGLKTAARDWTLYE